MRRTGRTPRAVTADRGYGEAAVDNALADLGVATVVIPRKGRPCRISSLKRGYGWDRSRIDGTEGTRSK